MIVPLQLFDVAITIETVVYGVLAFIIFSTMVSITVISYQGYRRYQSRAMKFFALGFGSLLLTQVLILPASHLLEFDPFIEQTSIQLTQAIGGLCILYAIRLNN
ncbi:DUF7521 family protein [Halogeometricum borinquense]|uniref:DUF7521 family protein n=1 Tax=Halogeometricum borinquense TaxID=60847 RepID=UPI00343DA0F2